MALPGDFLQDSQVSFLDKPACGAGVLIGVKITSLRSFIPLLMFGLHVALEWMERGPLLSFDCCLPPLVQLLFSPQLFHCCKNQRWQLNFHLENTEYSPTPTPTPALLAIENMISRLICSVLFVFLSPRLTSNVSFLTHLVTVLLCMMVSKAVLKNSMSMYCVIQTTLHL